MKIEMGESLFYSWLRHVKECQVVQTNWKVSSHWELLHEDDIRVMMSLIDDHFSEKYDYKVFKQNGSFRQVIRQGECDAIGICMQEGIPRYYAVDVAFHGAGLNYGSREETVTKVIEKCVRAALCIYGFMGSKEGEVIFASPKINNAIIDDLNPCIEEINELFKRKGFQFSFRIIANDNFNESVLQPILLISDGIADTSELFVRSYQMCTMFSDVSFAKQKETKVPEERTIMSRSSRSRIPSYEDDGVYKELKVGQIARLVLCKMLEEGAATEQEVALMQQAEYSRSVFHLNYPLLVRADSAFERARYYISSPITVHGVSYVVCSQWYETHANNDRPYLLRWIDEHTVIPDDHVVQMGVSPSAQPTAIAGSTNTGSHGVSDILPQALAPERSTSATVRSNNGGSITREMTDAVWRAFKHYSANGGDMSQLSQAVSKQTGMNSGSAFIYLGFLDNLVHGRYQKRNIKYSDVEIYMKYIHDEFGPQPYANALESLRQTLPYWRKTQKGKYAYYPDAIQKYLDTHSV